MICLYRNELGVNESKLKDIFLNIPKSSIVYISSRSSDDFRIYESKPYYSERWILMHIGKPSKNFLSSVSKFIADVIFICSSSSEYLEMKELLASKNVDYLAIPGMSKEDKITFVKNKLNGIHVVGDAEKEAKYLIKRCGWYIPSVKKVLQRLSKLEHVSRKEIKSLSEDMHGGNFNDIYLMMIGMYISARRKQAALDLLYGFKYAYDFVFKTLREESKLTLGFYKDIYAGELLPYNILEYCASKSVSVHKVRRAMWLYHNINYDVVYLVDCILNKLRPSILNLCEIRRMVG
jgi:hypothetical protein